MGARGRPGGVGNCEDASRGVSPGAGGSVVVQHVGRRHLGAAVALVQEYRR